MARKSTSPVTPHADALVEICCALLARHRDAIRQERVCRRLEALTPA